MKFLGLAVVAALLLTLVHAADECGVKCKARTERMIALRDASSTGVITMNSGDFEELLRTAPREYQTVLVLNALNPQHNCQPCPGADKEYKVAVSSFYRKHPDADNVFFVSIDYDGNQEVFRKLNCQSAPIFFNIPKKGKAERHNAPIAAAEEMQSYIRSVTGLDFPIYRAPDYTKMVIQLLLLVLIVVAVKILWKQIKPIVTNAAVWANIAMFFSFLMMSGHMWLQIRGAPYTVANKEGGMTLFSGSSSYQYGIESHAVMALYFIVATGIIMLNDKAAKARGASQGTLTLFWMAAVMLGFSFLYREFRNKYGGYPYKLFL